MRTLTYVAALREALTLEMERDERVVLLGEDIGAYNGSFKVTEGLLDRFGPERVRDTPISENTIVGVATGASLMGLRPVAEIMFMDFIGLALDQLTNHAAKFHYMYGGQKPVPIVVRTPAGGGRGYGPTHSQSLEAWLMHAPGIKIACPATPYDAKGMLLTAIRDDNPVLFLENKLLYKTSGEVPEGDYTVPLGQARIAREGKDLTIVTYSRMVGESLLAAEALEAQQGISAGVVDLRSLAPLDIATVAEAVQATGRCLVVTEDVKTAGVSAELACQIAENAFDYLDAPIRRLAAMDLPIPANRQLEDVVLPQRNSIATAAYELATA